MQSPLSTHGTTHGSPAGGSPADRAQAIPLAVAKAAAMELFGEIKPFCSQIRGAGDVRRERETVETIAFVVTPRVVKRLPPDGLFEVPVNVLFADWATKQNRIRWVRTDVEQIQPAMLKPDAPRWRGRFAAEGADRFLTVDFLFVPADEFGMAHLLETGPDDFVGALKVHAGRVGYRIEGYQLFKKRTRVPVPTEQSVFETLGLAPVAPKDRHGADDIRAAAHPGKVGK